MASGVRRMLGFRDRDNRFTEDQAVLIGVFEEGFAVRIGVFEDALDSVAEELAVRLGLVAEGFALRLGLFTEGLDRAMILVSIRRRRWREPQRPARVNELVKDDDSKGAHSWT